MDLTQLANLGEFIGGVAVLVTLIYLAVQFGQAKEMMRMESSRTTSKDVAQFFYELMDADSMDLLDGVSITSSRWSPTTKRGSTH